MGTILIFFFFLVNVLEMIIVMCVGSDDIVGPESMEKFCEDIGVEPENVSKIHSYISY